MAASSSATFFTPSGIPQTPINVSHEEFLLFHNIDRKLFSRLVFALGRDPGESAQVIALWMWLEHSEKEFNFVYKICANLPDTLLNAIADESAMALTCIKSDDFLVDLSINRDIPLMNALTTNGATLKYFHQNRLGILRGVTNLFTKVCMKAFEDLFPRPHQNNFAEVMLNSGINMRPHHHVDPVQHPLYPNAAIYDIANASNMGPYPDQRMYHGVVNNNQQILGPYQHLHLMASAFMRSDPSLDYLRGIFDHPYDLAAQRQILNEEMGEMLSRLHLYDDQPEAEEVSADERTIFLTFSKGYPISENEVREFFTRSHFYIFFYI